MERKAWPYMAGLMDTDGSIYLFADNRKDGKIGYGLIITAATTCRDLADWLVSNFGGTFIKVLNNRGFSKQTPKEIFYWRLFGKERQEAFLLGVLPYLKIKKERARIALDFLRLQGWNKEQRAELVKTCKRAKAKESDFQVSQLPKEVSGYVAGILDGDGSIYKTTIEIGSIEFFLVRWLLANFGGRFYTKVTANKKLFYIWRLSGRYNKEKFLLRVLPYLIVKRDKAKELLAFLRTIHVECPVDDSATTDTLSVTETSVIKTQSELTGDSKSALVETQEAIN
jgi:hypothetical protein